MDKNPEIDRGEVVATYHAAVGAMLNELTGALSPAAQSSLVDAVAAGGDIVLTTQVMGGCFTAALVAADGTRIEIGEAHLGAGRIN